MLAYQLACDSPWHYTSMHRDSAKVHFDGYYVRVHEDCSGGATVACRASVFQEREILPGLVAQQQIDSIYGAGNAQAEAIGANRARVRFAHTQNGPQERIYDLRPLNLF
jgi:hypothetical protein